MRGLFEHNQRCYGCRKFSLIWGEKITNVGHVGYNFYKIGGSDYILEQQQRGVDILDFGEDGEVQ